MAYSDFKKHVRCIAIKSVSTENRKKNPTMRNLTEYKNYSRLVKTKIILTKKHYEIRKFHQKIVSRSNSITI